MKEEFDALFAEHQKLLGELQAMRSVAKPEQEPWRESASDYERGVIDGMQKQMQSSVDKAVNRLAQPEQDQDEVDIRSRLYQRIHELETQLARGEQEPVGKFAKFTDGIWREVTDGSAGVPLYTTPPQRKPLMDEQIAEMWLEILGSTPPSGIHEDGLQPWRFARAIEAAHGIKE